MTPTAWIMSALDAMHHMPGALLSLSEAQSPGAVTCFRAWAGAHNLTVTRQGSGVRTLATWRLTRESVRLENGALVSVYFEAP